MSWEDDKRRLAAMSPEDREAWLERRRAKQRANDKARRDRKRAERIANGEVPRRIADMTPEQLEERAERRRRQNRESTRRRYWAQKSKPNSAIQEFLAQGAQEYGYSHFLHSEEHKKALRMNTGKELVS